MNKKRFYIISSTLLLIGLFAGVVQYIGVIDTIYAAINNPGHSWSQMECSTALCVDTVNNKVTMNSLSLEGVFYDKNGNTGSAGTQLSWSPTGLVWDGPLTYSNSLHTISECSALGGSSYDTGSGTICKAPLSSVPAGWTQAENWQRYSAATWGGDQCGRFKSTGPVTFANELSIEKYYVLAPNGNGCMFDHEGGCEIDYLWRVNDSEWCYFNSTENTSTNRVEVGLY